MSVSKLQIINTTCNEQQNSKKNSNFYHLVDEKEKNKTVESSCLGYGPKQLTFLPTSHEAPIKSNGSEISQEDVVILDEGGDSDYKEPNSLSNRIKQQLSTAISSASTRAEIAALATLISPVSSASGYMCS